MLALNRSILIGIDSSKYSVGLGFDQSVGLIAAGFTSTVIPGFSLLEIHDQSLCYLLDK
jgi:hypothetical protein